MNKTFDVDRLYKVKVNKVEIDEQDSVGKNRKNEKNTTILSFNESLHERESQLEKVNYKNDKEKGHRNTKVNLPNLNFKNIITEKVNLKDNDTNKNMDCEHKRVTQDNFNINKPIFLP